MGRGMDVKLTVALGALAVCVGGVGAWAVLGGDSSPAAASIAPSERHGWLSTQAMALGARLDANLPKSGAQPHMRVAHPLVNVKANAIQINIEVTGPYALDPALAGETTQAFYRMLCPSYVASDLGRDATTVLHNFYGLEGQGTLKFAISPETCRSKI